LDRGHIHHGPVVHTQELNIAGRHVVGNREPTHVFPRVGGKDVLPTGPDDHGEFGLVVDLVGRLDGQHYRPAVPGEEVTPSRNPKKRR
jgi:hypothetical protein